MTPALRTLPHWCTLWLLAASLPVSAGAEERAAPYVPDQSAPPEPVELFAAVEAGQIEVGIVPADHTKSTIRVKNAAEYPLEVRLPEAFVGEPVVENWRDYGGRTQAVGGGIPTESPGEKPEEAGPRTLVVPPGEERSLEAVTVCLDPGLPDPRPEIPYRLRPIEGHARNPALCELCAMLGREKINQKAAQAAAWFLDDGIPWPMLAAMRTRSGRGRTEAMFSAGEIRLGRKLAAEAIRAAVQKARKEKADRMRRKGTPVGR